VNSLIATFFATSLSPITINQALEEYGIIPNSRKDIVEIKPQALLQLLGEKNNLSKRDELRRDKIRMVSSV
jgi:hypothetical protein